MFSTGQDLPSSSPALISVLIIIFRQLLGGADLSGTSDSAIKAVHTLQYHIYMSACRCLGRVLGQATRLLSPAGDWNQRPHFALLYRSGQGVSCVKLDIDLQSVRLSLFVASCFSGLSRIDLSKSFKHLLDAGPFSDIMFLSMLVISLGLVNTGPALVSCIQHILVDQFSFVWMDRP